MNEVTTFFRKLLDTADFPPRWQCGRWSAFHGWLQIISDLMIWSAYFAIPFLIIRYFIQKRDEVHFNRLYLLFAAFILACGTTHFLDAMVFWIPVYRLSALVRLITGVISWFTVYYLFKLLPDAFSMKSPKVLEHEVALRKVAEHELNQKAADLERANHELEQFAFVASHDLQEPLRKISNFATMLERAIAEGKPENQQLYLGKISRSAARMQTLVNDILEFSRLNSQVAAARPAHIGSIAKAAVNELEDEIRQRHAEVAISDLDLRAEVIPNLLQQLFHNLITNALKYQAPGATPRVRISGRVLPEGLLAVTVADNGIGIAPEYQERIFQIFQRLHGRTEYEGTGIGLATCKRIAELHSGTIAVESAPGEGSAFTLRLPMKNAQRDEHGTEVPGLAASS